ncbi:bifunctional 2-polyprenyl-6-hydroxyphenol methylase/3-demethylubiquinol 3-O-methyltransferase UbiG [Actinomycetospora sp. TBRC 11914]|uniref:class I SAM-dependent methyltransferase n=1 Tax=Actinomycetospora sp. TBRC 11914 TaxID=2729387 RepID=UPI00145DC26B|nr:class I SAM-dependent methyltransferase [Actinomycetospora sp. TBRC 11914]NMO89719.1 class I SAM-dependent methyltransferase [Actinomycetospora sp. TBRC 11914]
MADADRERWDRRFATVGPGTPGPPSALVGREDLVPTTGAALDLACGRGTVAVWFAGRGLTTTAVDVSPEALRLTAALAEARGVAVTTVRADLDDGLSVTGPFDVVVCQRFRDPRLYAGLIELLVPGGLLVVSVLSTAGDEGGSYRAGPGELRSAFGHLDVLVDEEGNGEAHLVARVP